MNAAGFAVPHSVEAEQSVLGGLLLQPEALDRITDLVGEQDFYRADHRAIWRAAVALIEAGQPGDIITVAEALERHGRLAEVGGLAYLSTLAQITPSAANIRRYAEIVRERAALRALGRAAMDLQAAIHAPDGQTPSDIARGALAALEAVAEPLQRNETEPATAAQAVAEVLRAADDAGSRRGLTTGLDDLDALTNGIEPGQLIIVAARPAVGKTALALAITRNAAQHGARALFASLEMSRAELAARLLSATAGINGRSLRTGPNPAEWERLAGAATAPWLARLTLDDRPAASVAYLRARARKLKRHEGVTLIIVDYLQLMAPADPRASRTEQVGSLSRGLKALAKELGVPIIALAQLNRASEARADKRPQLYDLRDSGEIEQDADAVLLLHPAGDGVLECHLAKHRNGPTGIFWLDFDAARMTFSRRYGPPPSPTKTTRGGFAE